MVRKKLEALNVKENEILLKKNDLRGLRVVMIFEMDSDTGELHELMSNLDEIRLMIQQYSSIEKEDVYVRLKQGG
jgi:hypothetical protein